MKILIVDDENSKVVEITRVVQESGVDPDVIQVVTTAAAAVRELKSRYYDLLIIDLVLPLRVGEKPERSGGVSLLKQVHRSSEIQAPEFILGLTADEAALSESKDSFADVLWSVELSGHGSGEWKLRLQQKLQYLIARENWRDGLAVDQELECDVLFVCALLDPELIQLHAASGVEWEKVTFPSDPTVYWKTQLVIGSHSLVAYSMCLPQMGLVSAASGVSQATRTLAPKVVAMTGICAGRKGDCDLGDAIAATLTWDYGSGKFVKKDGDVVFEPSPIQVIADATVQSAITALIADNGKAQKYYDECSGYRTKSVPRIHKGPLASGAAVQNHEEFFSGVASQHRKILGVDMEAFGVAWACYQSLEPQPKWLVVKGVSDFADGTKEDDIQSFASYFSARVCLDALADILGN